MQQLSNNKISQSFKKISRHLNFTTQRKLVCGGVELTNHGYISEKAAVERARRISKNKTSKNGKTKWHDVLLIGSDDEDTSRSYSAIYNNGIQISERKNIKQAA